MCATNEDDLNRNGQECERPAETKRRGRQKSDQIDLQQCARRTARRRRLPVKRRPARRAGSLPGRLNGGHDGRGNCEVVEGGRLDGGSSASGRVGLRLLAVAMVVRCECLCRAGGRQPPSVLGRVDAKHRSDGRDPKIVLNAPARTSAQLMPQGNHEQPSASHVQGSSNNRSHS